MSNDIAGPRNIVYTSIAEAQQGKAADGKNAAPEGAKPVVVEPGDTLSEIASKNKMSLAQLYALNPQFDPANPKQSRNPDLIYPNEVVYVKDPEAKASVPGDGNNDGKPDKGSPQATDTAAANYDKASQAAHSEVANKQESEAVGAEYTKKGEAFKQAVKDELATGASADDIINRLGGSKASADVVAAVREADTDFAASKVATAQSRSATTDSQVTFKENGIAAAKTALETSVRAELAGGANPADIKQRLNAGKTNTLSVQEVDSIVDAATKPATRTNPIGGDAAKAATLSPAHDTNQAAANLSPSESGKTAADHQAAFVKAARSELEQGASVAELKARYGNDPNLNTLIDQASKPG